MLLAGAPMAPAMLRCRCAQHARDGGDKLLPRRHLGHGFDTGDVQSVLTHCTTKNNELLILFGEFLGNLGRSHGVLGIGQNGHARQRDQQCFRMAFPQGRFWRACSWQHARTHPRRVRAHEGPAFQQLSDRRSGQPQRRQSFQRSGRVRRPTVLFVLYPQFHSKFGRVSPRLSFAGTDGPDISGPYGVLRIAADGPSGCIRRKSAFSRLRQELC